MTRKLQQSSNKKNRIGKNVKKPTARNVRAKTKQIGNVKPQKQPNALNKPGGIKSKAMPGVPLANLEAVDKVLAAVESQGMAVSMAAQGTTLLAKVTVMVVALAVDLAQALVLLSEVDWVAAPLKSVAESMILRRKAAKSSLKYV
jgi:hypothetical protein